MMRKNHENNIRKDEFIKIKREVINDFFRLLIRCIVLGLFFRQSRAWLFMRPSKHAIMRTK